MTAALKLVENEQHDPDEAFWLSRPQFTAIQRWARARRVSPWAVLGVILAKIITNTPPNVLLPAIVGGPGSLNTFLNIVGRSGQGKGAAGATANEALEIGMHTLRVARANLGSGEGISAAFVGREQNEDGDTEIVQHTDSVLFEVAEVDTFAATGNRTGSTLMPEVRKVWSGEALGFQNRDSARTLPVEAHSYRAAMIVGVQPTRSGALLRDADGGTPQRFIWLPATDPYAPDRAPAPPEVIRWDMPGEHVLPTIDGRRTLRVCDTAWETIDRAQIARLRGEGDALDGHALFSRLKVAAALTLFDQRGDVNDDDWELSSYIMRVSDATRKACLDALEEVAKSANVARAEARAEAAAVTADHTETALLERAKERVILKATTEWESAANLRIALSTKIRPFFEVAVDQLESASAIEVLRDEYQNRPRVRIRLNTVSPDKKSALATMPQLPHDSNEVQPCSTTPDRADEKSGLPHTGEGNQP
ncbi:hypothetical protein ACWGOE_01735 [Leucobacter chromiiresistens]